MSTKTKAPTLADMKADIRWTKDYINQIMLAKREGRYADAAELCNEISCIWGSFSGQFEEAE